MTKHKDKDKWMIGRRVRLRHCTDEFTELTPGAEGTVSYVDDMGTVFVDWDSGSRLGLLPGVDRFEVLP